LIGKESYLLLKKIKSDGLMIVLLAIILWFPFYFWEISGAAYRLFHVGVLIVPLILLFLIRDFDFKKTVAIGVIVLLCALSFVSWKSYDPTKQDPPYALYTRVTKTLGGIVKDHQPELIIAHKSLAEFFTYSTGIDAMPWLPDYRIEESKLWRIAFLPYDQLYVHYTKSTPTPLGGKYYYVSESQWQSYLAQLRKNESADLVDAHLTWQNPNEVRPEFLRKKN
jgi:hypothetical protein